jgi:hypothetical protein
MKRPRIASRLSPVPRQLLDRSAGPGRMVSITEVIGTTMVWPATEITMPSITASVSGSEMVNSVPSPGVRGDRHPPAKCGDARS